MTPSAFIEESDLHALVDGEVDVERRRRVEDYLLQHPEDAALVEGWRRQNAALRAAFEPVALETLPFSLRDAARRAPVAQQAPIESGAIHFGRPGVAPRPARRFDEMRAAHRRQAIGATALALLTGGVLVALAALVFAGRGEPRAPVSLAAPQGYVARAGLAFMTYVVDARPVEIEAARRAELVDWLQARVGYSVLPDLSPVGLRLLGGRIAPGVAAPAGFLVYERADGARVGLYFERAVFGGAAQAPRAGVGVAAIEWRAAGFDFVLVGALNAGELQAAAERAAASVVPPQGAN